MINVDYFSFHLCKPVHEVQQVCRSVSFLLLVQAQKHLLLLFQVKNKYLAGGRCRRSVIWMAFPLLKCKPMLKKSQLALIVPGTEGQQRNHKPWPYSSWQIKNKRTFWLNYPCLKATLNLNTKPENLWLFFPQNNLKVSHARFWHKGPTQWKWHKYHRILCLEQKSQ